MAKFPENFLWGTSTSALQIESAGDHDWNGLIARDGSQLGSTIKHELYRKQDAKIIASLGNAYRFSMDWSKLQKEPYGKLESKIVDEYRDFMGDLKDRNIHLMLVLHHFANPNWFAKKGGWTVRESSDVFRDYAKQVAFLFGDLVDSWNTINEPNVYASQAYVMGNFPPFKKSDIVSAIKVVNNMSRAHDHAYDEIKKNDSDQKVGVSNNTMVFSPYNISGIVPAKFADLFSHWYVPNQFTKVDFVGISYYGRVQFDPNPISQIDSPGKLDNLRIKHDDMWEYYPQGLKEMLLRFSDRYNKPIIITEHGFCSDEDFPRIQSIRDHLWEISVAKEAKVEGYFYWSTFDNFELHLGSSYKFGLVAVDPITFERTKKPSAYAYSRMVKNHGF